MCIKSEVEEIFFKLATNDQRWGLPVDIKFWPKWVVCPCPRAMYMHKIMKQMHKMRGQNYFFWNVQRVIKVIRLFCFHQNIVPKSCLFLPWGYMYMYEIKQNIMWTASSEFGTYRLCEQQRFRRACASAQSRQNLRCSLIQAVSQEEPSDRKPDPWPLWMAGHAQLEFVMTECSKTQIRLTGPM